MSNEPEMKFDPMTGKPLQKEEPSYFEQNQGNGAIPPVAPKKNNKWVVPVVIAAGVVVVGGVGAFAATKVVPRIAYGKNYTVLEAVKNTEGSSRLMQNLFPSEKIINGKYSVDLSAKVNNVCDIKMKGVGDRRKAQAVMNTDVDITPLNLSFGLDWQVNQEVVTVQSDDFMKGSAFTYDYSKNAKTDGYLGEMLASSDFTQKDLNEYFREAMSNQADYTEMPKELWDATKSQINEMDFTDADSEKFEMDGEKVNCQGYKTTFTKKEMKKLVKSYKDVIEKYYSKEMLKLMEKQGTSFDDSFEELDRQLDDMDDIDTTLYIGKKGFFGKSRIVACKMKNDDGDEILLELLGGNYPMENIKMTSEKEDKSIERKGEMDGDKEKVEYLVDGEKAFSYTYDTKDGDLTFTLSSDGEDVSIEGELVSKPDEYSIKLDEVKATGFPYEVSFEYTAKAGGDFKELDKASDEYKLESMSQEEYQAMVAKMSQDPFVLKVAGLMQSVGTGDGPTSIFSGGSLFSNGSGGYGSDSYSSDDNSSDSYSSDDYSSDDYSSDSYGSDDYSSDDYSSDDYGSEDSYDFN